MLLYFSKQKSEQSKDRMYKCIILWSTIKYLEWEIWAHLRLLRQKTTVIKIKTS